MLAELKQECLARGLETKGIKQDLINRLQAYLEEHAEEEANEEDVLGDETEEEEPKPIELPVKEEEPPEKSVDVAAEKKVVKITSELPQTERMQKRAERFNVPVSLESKKAARAARFGISSVPTKGLTSDIKPSVNLDKLKERAQRFGLNVSSISRKAGSWMGSGAAGIQNSAYMGSQCLQGKDFSSCATVPCPFSLIFLLNSFGFSKLLTVVVKYSCL
ncbi:SAP domain-containing ribonucleoprotein isoform X2 [Ochotona curzoniae]|uniref:SAP domain-containing ribonucleoprotein isoform X2 n=1 Tax=Ochotona curzoniae TaxID=130825 RepID=UPI001B34BA3B|nr:SAP domain-containing ribonucleoprotein isoform X2 [Ochotona curzoniae]